MSNLVLLEELIYVVYRINDNIDCRNRFGSFGISCVCMDWKKESTVLVVNFGFGAKILRKGHGALWIIYIYIGTYVSIYNLYYTY